MTTDLSSKQTIVATSHQVSTPMNNETVLLHLVNGAYYSLNRVGTAIWESLQSPTTLETIVDALVSRFEVEREVCEADARKIVTELLEAGLVETRE